jgi:Transglycosylase SLT domain
MRMILRWLAVLAIGAVLQGSLLGLAVAQGPAPGLSPANPGPGYGGGVPDQASNPAAPTESEPATALPVLYVTSVEILRTQIEPQLDIVRVTGLTGLQDWNSPELLPTFAGKPLDGILDLQFTATMPLRTEALDRVALAVDGVESSHGANAKMWRPEVDGPQGPMQVSAAAAMDVGDGDRFDPGENRALGRAYLARLYRRYANWVDAVAAYNWGPGHMDAWIDSGRPIDKFPETVALYRVRVLYGGGATPGHHIQPRRPLADRLCPSRSSTAVEQLYDAVMRDSWR